MKNNILKHPLLAPAALIMATFAWGSSFIALKHSIGVFSPYFVICCRMVIASICFLFLRRFFGKNQYIKGDWLWLLLMSLAEPCLYFVFEAYALKYTTAGSAGVINSLLPPLIAIAGWFVYRRKLSMFAICGLSLAIIGSIGLTLSTAPTEVATRPILGNLLEFGAMVSSCLYVLILEKISSRYPPFFLTAMQAFIGSIFFIPLAFTQPILLVPASSLEWTHVFSLFYLGIFVTLGGYFLYNWGIANIGASQSSMFVNLVPVFALLMSALILNEQINMVQLLCIILILAGVFISQYSPKKTHFKSVMSEHDFQ
jgi:drug/metabolite transporter (DMT)-like permease